MTIVEETIPELTAPLHVYSNAVVDITSTNPAAQDDIIPARALGALTRSKSTLQCTESNNVAVNLQP